MNPRLVTFLLAAALACACERDLPPVPKIERLTFEGTIPEGFTLDGVAVMRATKKTRQCFGTLAWLWRHTGGGDQQGYPLHDVEPTFEVLEGSRYRLHFRFHGQEVGGPCRWQLEAIQINAKWAPEADGRMQVYHSHRTLDESTELWKGPPRDAVKPLTIPCLYVAYDEMRELCEERVPGDQGIPMFEGTLTIPLDVYVPGGLEAARARLRAELALDQEDTNWHAVLGQQREQEWKLKQLEAGSDGAVPEELRDASSEDLAARRAAIEREIERLQAEGERRERALKAKRKQIADKFEQEREPYPEGYPRDAGSDAAPW